MIRKDLAARAGALENELGEAKQAAETLHRQNVYLTALHETSPGLIDHPDKAKLYADVRRELAERKRTEAILRESEQRYRLLLESSPDPIGLYNIQVKATYVNPAFEQTFGSTNAELLCISKNTVLFRRHNIRQKPGLKKKSTCGPPCCPAINGGYYPLFSHYLINLTLTPDTVWWVAGLVYSNQFPYKNE
jgi:PAS domain-containing protein